MFFGTPPDSVAQRWKSILRRAATHRFTRRVEAYSFAIAFEQVAIQEGLRAAAGVATMVAAAVWLDWPRLGWAAFGAFWTCLADPGGTDRSRFAYMGLFAVAGTITAVVASATAGISPFLAAAVLIPLVFVPSLSPMYGVEASRVGTLVCVVAVVAVAFPNPPGAALSLAGLFLAGCLWAMILCIGIWRIHHYAPARRATVAVFAQLGSTICDLLALGRSGRTGRPDWDRFNAEHRRSIRAAIERARGIVAGLETSNARYRLEVEIADRVFAALVAIGHALGERGTPVNSSTERDLLHRLLLSLAEAQHQAGRRAPRATLLSSEATALEGESLALANVIGRGIGAAAQALKELAETWQGGAGRFLYPPAAIEQGATRILKPIPAIALSHAARAAIAVVISYAIASSLNLTFSYWATVATVVVVQPETALVWQRSIERVLGSIAGGLLAALLMFAFPAKIALLGLIFPIAAATIAFRLVNYAIFVLFATSLFVLVTELLQPVPGIASIRALDNVIGSLVGLAASLLLWRHQGAKQPGEVVAEAVKANFAYAAQVVAATATAVEVDVSRRAAGVASGAAETMLHSMRLEGQRGRAHLAQMADLLDALRRLAGSVTASYLGGCPADAARAAALVGEAGALADAVMRPLAAAPPAVLPAEPRDDVERAVRGVTAAAAAYVGAFEARSPVLISAPD
jgi:uncharacterized membrane protein YccC